MSATGPWVEAESVPLGEVVNYFVPPPDLMSPWFPRSAVVSGSLGAGKTMLLRYLAETEPDFVITVNLLEELSCVGDPAVPLASHPEGGPAYAELAEAKAVALLGMTIVQKLKAEVDWIPSAVDACIPPGLRAVVARGQDLRGLKRALAEAPLDQFRDIPTRSQPLRELVEATAEHVAGGGTRLLVLFDRAELVRPRLLNPVMRLLEKSRGYRAIVAMRPGAVDASYIEEGGRFAAGDDYDTVHLGRSPRSATWRAFADEVFERQMPDALQRISPADRELIHTASRESLRYAIRLCSVYLNASGDDAERSDTLSTAVELLRTKHVQSIIGNMRGYHPNFGAFLSSIRRDFAKGAGRITGPCVLDVLSASSSTGRRPEVDQFARFMEHALRHSALLVPDGEDWQPYTHVSAVEVPPLCMWRRGEPWWTTDSMSPLRLVINDHQFFRTGQVASRGPSKVFLAFEFSRSKSMDFRDALDETFEASSDEGGLILATGENIVGGPRWGEDIARRIKEASMVVGDVSGRGREVFFEVGYAYGLGKPFLFVVEEQRDIVACPEWVRTNQIDHYGSTEGFELVMQSLRAMSDRRVTSRWPVVSRAEPDCFVWLGEDGWTTTVFKQAEVFAAQNDLTLECHEYASPPTTPGEVDDVLRSVASAGLVVVPFDGTDRDFFSNLLLGMVAAKRFGAGRTARRALVVSLNDAAMNGEWVSASALQAKSIRRVSIDRLGRAMRDYSKALRGASRQ